MRLLAGYLPAPAGSEIRYGANQQKMHATLRRKIGYLPENNPLYEDMYVRELLGYFGNLYGMSRKKLQGRAEEVMEGCGLKDVARKKVHMLSKGYRQRLGIARSLLHEPKILILDEPTSGLDPNQLVEMRALIRNLGDDISVLLSTHILQEVEATCDEVLLLHKGRFFMKGPLEDFKTGGNASSLEEIFQNLTQKKNVGSV